MYKVYFWLIQSYLHWKQKYFSFKKKEISLVNLKIAMSLCPQINTNLKL